jgi:nitroimidazol reductase NimA-like FMN-containing flavoprotein (pyridoxamine 5'-phosphate oxidase superfamily)
MKYDTTGLRRQEKAMPEADARKILTEGEYGVLSMRAEDTGAYGVGMNYAWDGEDKIYFHGAPKGRKYELMRACNKVSFTVVGKTERVQRRFTMAFDDVIVEGTIQMDLPEEEVHKALRLILEKYCPDVLPQSVPYEQKMAPHTCVFRMDISKVCGKRSI